MKSFMIAALGVVCACGAPVIQAKDRQGTGPRGGFLVQSDIEFGGDTVATVDFENGDSQNVHAGQGISLGVGGYLRPSKSVPVEIAAVVGYKYVTTAANNADIHMSRTVIKLNATYWFENGWFITGGLTHHISPELDGDGFFSNVPFDDATGFSAEGGWRWIALRYTNIKYKFPGFQDTDASSVGLSFTYRFGGHRGGY